MIDFDAIINRSVLATLGDTVTFQPIEGGSEMVTAIRTDASSLQDGFDGAQMVLFVSVTESGLSKLPVKRDRFVVNDVVYRVFDVKTEANGGRGVWVGLTAQ